MHEWVVSLDANSLYPSLIIGHNISPETIVSDIPEGLKKHHNKYLDKELIASELDLSDLKDHDLCMATNGQFFTREKQGFLGEILEKMYTDRVHYKNKMIDAEKRKEKATSEKEKTEIEKDIATYKNLQLAKKVGLNSCYGTIGTPYFRYFNIKLAEAVTLSGQLAIRWIENALNGYMNNVMKTKDVEYVIASDTDSVYIHFGPLVKKVLPNEKNKTKIVNFLDKIITDAFEPFIKNKYNELAEYINAYQQKMVMSREVIADKGIWTAKKRYILNVYDSEGVRYKKPKQKIMGIETARSSTPEVCRKRLKTAIKIILSKDEDFLIDYIEKFKKKFKSLPPEDVAFPRGISELSKYKDASSIYKKGTPIHVKAAIIHNNLLAKHKLTKKYEKIQNGDKIKFIYLKDENPVKANAIAFNSSLPEKFNLHKYIDYNKQFDKTFLDPLKNILNCIGWKTKHIATLERFFK